MISNNKPIVFVLDAQGGFTVGDTLTGRTSYAYPTSEHATAAKKNPHKVAAKMIANDALTTRIPRIHDDYDRINWLTLNLQG